MDSENPIHETENTEDNSSEVLQVASALRHIRVKESVKSSEATEANELVSLQDLRNLFQTCLRDFISVQEYLERQDTKEFQDRIARLIGQFGECSSGIARLEVFSENEHLEDINTEDLDFILLGYYSAKLLLKRQGENRNPAERLKFVNEGIAALESFVTSCDKRGVVSSLFPSEDLDELILIPKVSREEKIKRMKDAMKLKQEIEKVESRMSATNVSGSMEEASIDEELQRERKILTIKHTVYMALEDLASSSQEVELLQRFANVPSPAPVTQPANPPPSKGLTVTHISKDGIQTRETIKANVFKQSWRSPTMTLDEYAEIEMQQAIEREKRAAAADKMDKKYETLVEEGLEDEMDLVDKATYRDRGWDDYKDDHPKGSGVTNRF